jgi:uncharacterized protein (DUF362 family)
MKKNRFTYDPDRRKFVTDCVKYGSIVAGISAITPLISCASTAKPANPEKAIESTIKKNSGVDVAQNVVVKASKGDPYDLTMRAVEALGGMDKFVKEGESVMLMPNIAWDRSPEQAANTHPDVVRAVVEMCKKAGAKEIGVFCNPCHPAQSTYAKSGIANAAEKAGAKIYFVQPGRDFKEIQVNGKNIKTVKAYTKLLESDRFISIPIAKVHSLSKYTMCMKNMMGAIEDRPVLHPNIQQDLADLHMILKPDLNIIDASRILVRNGPTGGSLADVQKPEIVIAAPNPVSADSVGMGLFGKTASDLPCLAIAQALGRGVFDLDELEIREA